MMTNCLILEPREPNKIDIHNTNLRRVAAWLTFDLMMPHQRQFVV